jgi:SAM-dependent methyltransferase
VGASLARGGAPRRKIKSLGKKTRRNRERAPVVLNAGAGAHEGGGATLPDYFKGWRQLRIDVDPLTKPDLVASVADLSAIPDGSVDAVWCAHCIEHVFAHEVPRALAEFRRVLVASGFACIIVPDLQAIGEWLSGDRLHETIYQSPAGPVTPHDMLWGYGPAIAQGSIAMAHRCGFTPTLLLRQLEKAGFLEIVLRRSSNLELRALVLPQLTGSSARRDELMTALAL